MEREKGLEPSIPSSAIGARLCKQLNKADGVIDLPNDILGVIQQYNHDCR